LSCGSSGSGKTSVIFKALLEGQFKFTKLYIFAKDIYEGKYEYLIKHFAQIAEEMGKQPEELLVVGCEVDHIVKVNDLDPTIDNLMIFDDFITEKKAMETTIKEHFIRGRKKNCSYIFISQSYFSIPRDIRINCDYYMLFRPGQKRDGSMIGSDMSEFMDYSKFMKLFKHATEKKYNFLLVDKKTEIPQLKLRHGWTGFLRKPIDDSDSESE
jgi:hypothetical protein